MAVPTSPGFGYRMSDDPLKDLGKASTETKGPKSFVLSGGCFAIASAMVAELAPIQLSRNSAGHPAG